LRESLGRKFCWRTNEWEKKLWALRWGNPQGKAKIELTKKKGGTLLRTRKKGVGLVAVEGLDKVKGIKTCIPTCLNKGRNS